MPEILNGISEAVNTDSNLSAVKAITDNLPNSGALTTPSVDSSDRLNPNLNEELELVARDDLSDLTSMNANIIGRVVV